MNMKLNVPFYRQDSIADCGPTALRMVLSYFNKDLGIKVIKDPNATCDSEGKYMFLNIQPGETTKIKQTGPSCYVMEVKDCEILKATERMMVETFVRYEEVSK